MVEFSLDNQKYSVTRPKLRKWLSIEKIRSEVLESADRDKFIDSLFAYLSALLDTEPRDAPWYEVLEAYYLVSIECYPKLDLSILLSGKEKKDKLPDPWDYEARTVYSWIHLLAKTYGWTIEYISELDVDDAFALIQETSLEDQFEKEWQWGLSEISYESDGHGKSKLRPLPRPDWMNIGNRNFQKAVEKPKKVFTMRQDFIPPGVVIYNAEQESKTINTEGSSDTT